MVLEKSESRKTSALLLLTKSSLFLELPKRICLGFFELKLSEKLEEPALQSLRIVPGKELAADADL